MNDLRSLGNTNISIFPIGLGGMPLSTASRPDEKQAIEVIHKALDLGINFIDTADVYCLDHTDIGHNERLIAKALQCYLDKSNKVLIATKGGLERPSGAWTTNGDPRHLQSACEASLRALNQDCIELYQFHAPDIRIPFTISIEKLADLKKQGKIKHLGLSNVNVEQIKIAQEITPIVSVQNRCHVFCRDSFINGVIDFCEKNQITFIPYSPVGGSHGKKQVQSSPILLQIANEHHKTPFQIALAWLLAKSPCMVPIPAATKLSSISDSFASTEIDLSPESIEQIDNII